jgi:hypothetical protein
MAGGRCDDVLEGGTGFDELDPGDGADDVHAGHGDDQIDLIVDGEIDLITCGAGEDTVAFPEVEGLDPLDVIAADCEGFLPV